MYGFFLIDKPIGMTSFDVIRVLKKKFQTKRIGHTGTLDPLATGCLLVALGEYTKLIPYLEKESKSYLATIELGGVSDTYDREGNRVSLDAFKQEEYKKSISRELIEKTLKQYFTGKILQTPPKVSALKIAGKKALERFRDGEEFEMKSRQVEVFSIKLISYQYPLLEIEVQVSAGTYIRSIAHDFGQILGCGGYIASLRRNVLGNLDISRACSLDTLSAENHLSLSELFSEDQCKAFSDTQILERLSHGQRVYREDIFPEDRDFFLLSERGVEFVVSYKNKILSPIKKIFT